MVVRPTGGPKRDDVRGPLLGSRFLGSFVPAVRGLGRAARAERNLRIQLGAGVVALGLAAGLRLDAVEWACVILAVGLVITTELVNTAVEAIIDLLSPGPHPVAGLAKDVAAAAALTASLAAAGVGAAVFGPHLLALG